MRMKVNRFKHTIFSVVILLLGASFTDAQMLVPLSDNPVIKKHLAEKQVLLKSTRQADAVQNIVTPPFFDDFSNISVFPDPGRWSDRYAFINATFPVEPISLGVATLDAIDDEGNIYPVGNRPESCDTLTSVGIDLSVYAGNQKPVYLSFFYQPQGNGEAPETKDSLVVEFFSPASGKWYHAWSTPGMPLQPFTIKIIEVADSLLQYGFRFRFRNYVSMSDQDTQSGYGALGNLDLWHIDYVRLNDKPLEEHEKVDDVSFLYPLKSSYKNYTSIPWDHVDSANFNYRREFMPIVFRTTITLWSYGKTTERKPVSIGRGIFMRNVKTGQYIIPPFTNGEAENLLKDSVYLREDTFVPEISYDGSDYGLIETGAFIVNSPEDIHINDTVKNVEFFQYHYSYDDGTPERGFGNPGPLGGRGSYIAVYFQIYRTDLLRAVDIYFNRTRNNYTGTLNNAFRLCVWQNNSGQPGTLVYESSRFYTPDTTVPAGQFMRILLDSAIFIKDGVYVGIRQNTNEFLNIGYDVNNANKNKIYINNLGTWESFANTSVEEGSLMIRPVMSRNPVALGLSDNLAPPPLSIAVSPNPASDYIHFRLENSAQQIAEIAIYDMLGKKIELPAPDAGCLDISHLRPGIYILRVITAEGGFCTSKFLKSR
ncbi:MAG: T9SS type A sorting domain-containing protein [Bacteroidales bacterium]